MFGHSSGAVLALEAAGAGLAIDKLVAYEPPYATATGVPRDDVTEKVRAQIAAGDRDGAAATFLEVAGTPPEMIEGMKSAPVWGWFTGLAHTLPYDLEICGPGAHPRTDHLARITAPTLVIGGGASPEKLQSGARVGGRRRSREPVTRRWRGRTTGCCSTRSPCATCWSASSSTRRSTSRRRERTKMAGAPESTRHFRNFSPQPRTTLPALMHEVHTFKRLRWDTPTLAWTVWMFGFHRRLVRRWECETDLPKPGPLPQTSHTAATSNSFGSGS